MLRLSTTMTVVSGETRMFRSTSTANGGLSEGVIRPLYSDGTIHVATPDLVAERPATTSSTLIGFAITGNGINTAQQADFDYYWSILNTAKAEAADSLTLAARAFMAAITSYDVYVARTGPHGEFGYSWNHPVAPAPVVPNWEYWAANQTDNIKHCSGAPASDFDYGMDLEQVSGGDDIVVSAMFNIVGLCSGYSPFYNEADVDLITFDPASNSPTNSTPTFIHHGSGIEWFPNVAPTPDDGYAVVLSTVANKVVVNKTDAYIWKGNSSLTQQWERFFLGVGDDLCAFGLALTMDGGYVVSGNNDATTTRNQNEVVVKLSNDCQVNFTYDNDYSSNTGSQDISTAVSWDNTTVPSGVLTVRGTVHITSTGSLTIKDGVQIEFADTRQTVDIGSVDNAKPSRILVEVGGVLELEDDVTLTSLQGGCNEGNMWDGITVLGTPNLSQIPANQGVVQTRGTSGATIENARFGLLVGRPTYGTGTTLTFVAAKGGGVVAVTDVTLRNCYTGAYFAPLSNNVNNFNKSFFQRCTFVSDAPLTDPVYISGGERYGTQTFLQLRQQRMLRVKGCTFTGYMTTTYQLRGIGIYGNDAGAVVECENFNLTTGACSGTGSTFQNLYRGIFFENHGGGGELVARGNTFTTSYAGIYLGSSTSSQIRNNIFDVGEASLTFPYGLQYYNSTGTKPEGNTFQRHTGLTASAFTRGLTVGGANGTSGGPPFQVYNNTFTSLATGFYSQSDNSNVTFRCNGFSGSTRADVELLASQIKDPQGFCDAFNSASTPNNVFSNVCSGSAKDILLGTGASGFTYAYPTNSGMQPGNGNATCGSVGTGKVVLDPCPYSNSGGCPTSVFLRTVGDLKAQIDTVSDAYERGLLLNDLLLTYLTDTTVTHGLDSAIALLQRLTPTGYGDVLAQLQARAAETVVTTGNSYRQAAPGRISVAQSRRGAGGGTMGPQTESGEVNYFRRVLELLEPLGTDSARAAAIANDGDLHDELVAMATDSMAWGSQAARAALNHYAGAKYHEWGMPMLEGGSEAERSLGAKTPAATAASNSLRLLPNPSTGQVQVSWPGEPDQQGELAVYDSWGRLVQQQALAADETELALLLRPGLYHCLLRVAGTVVAKDKLLIIR